MKKYEKRIEKLNIQYEKEVEKIAIQAFNEYIFPFCKKNNYSFFNGMGIYSFSDIDNRDNFIWNDSLPKRIQSILDIEIKGNFTLGEYMPNYDHKTGRIK